MGDELLKAAVRPTQDARRVGFIANRSLLERVLCTRQPGSTIKTAHTPLVCGTQREHGRTLAGQAAVPQTAGQLQDRALMADHLLKAGGLGALHGEHRTVHLTDRGKLGRITNKHKTCAEGMGTLQCHLQEGTVDHRRFINQHQPQMLQRGCRLFRRFTQLAIALTLELKRQGDRELCCLLYTSPSPRDKRQSRMPSSA